MATREENLKKINDELEKLDDEQLEQIAGGHQMFMPEQNPNTDTAQNIFPNQLIAKKQDNQQKGCGRSQQLKKTPSAVVGGFFR